MGDDWVQLLPCFTYLLTCLLTYFVQLVVGSLCVGRSSAPSQGEDKPLLVFVRSFSFFSLVTQAKLCDQCAVAVWVFLAQVCK
jgi:hypothetical protein